ncbi:MAG TPA: sensor histidine kinase [Ktedonobacteraceae bacterium]|jgi:two-component system sensor histidine kinase UhpB|nr:sensor histidine kinase [Ktedonobacteraceae bacterium]
MIYSRTNFETEEEPVRKNRMLKPLLSIPVFYKVLIANSLIIFIGATGGTWLATHLNKEPYATPMSLIIFIAIGWLISIVLNFVVLQVAFRPLFHLGKVMDRVQQGERSLRAPLTGVDPEADQLARTFNMMLEALDEASHQRANQIIKAQEQERKRIARELHDETSQVLTSLLISLAVLEESIGPSEARERIAETRALAHQTLRAIRSLSIDLRPSALDDLGLLPALRWYIKEYQKKCAIEVEFQASGLKERLPAEMETALYRIVQESLTNTARHANAHKVTISLKEEGEAIHATIIDDGRGFDYDALVRTGGQERSIGLAGMQERAVLLDGILTIHSAPGCGTRVEAHIPLPSSTEWRRSAIDELTTQEVS